MRRGLYHRMSEGKCCYHGLKKSAPYGLEKTREVCHKKLYWKRMDNHLLDGLKNPGWFLSHSKAVHLSHNQSWQGLADRIFGQSAERKIDNQIINQRFVTVSSTCSTPTDLKASSSWSLSRRSSPMV